MAFLLNLFALDVFCYHNKKVYENIKSCSPFFVPWLYVHPSLTCNDGRKMNGLGEDDYTLSLLGLLKRAFDCFTHTYTHTQRERLWGRGCIINFSFFNLEWAKIGPHLTFLEFFEIIPAN